MQLIIDYNFTVKQKDKKYTVANIGSYFIRVSEVLQVQFPLANFVLGKMTNFANPYET
jgi:hypothetical protein